MLNTTKINETLGRKFDSWVSSIEDHKVRELAKNNTIITGGCIPSMILEEEVKDFDLYFRDFTTMYEVTNYYIERFNPRPNTQSEEIALHLSVRSSKKFGKAESSENRRLMIEIYSSIHGPVAGIDEKGILPKTEMEGQEMITKLQDTGLTANYRPVFVTTNAVTLSDKVQCMVRFWGEPDDIHENYDFAHCTNYWTSWKRQTNLRSSALDALKAKELRYTGTSKYPVSALVRVKKFLDRGWTITDDEVSKIAESIEKLDLQNPDVRREQMVGVSSTAMTFIETNLTALSEQTTNYKDFMKLLNDLRAINKRNH